MATINPYLYFNGNCEEAFNFYSSVFNSEISHLEYYQDAPATARQLFKEVDSKIMHATLPISKETFLMGADHTESFSQPCNNQNFSLIVHAESKEEADRIFKSLSLEGHIKVDLDMSFWGSYFGICTDKYGITWKITCTIDH